MSARPLGAHVIAGGVHFSVWAPAARSVSVQLSDVRLPMERVGDGRFSLAVSGAQAGDDYWFVLDDERARPDPRSRFQPEGVFGPSRVVDPRAFEWDDDGWRGLPLEKYVLYELHVGAFTTAGTFEAILARLPHLAALGVTAVELMPVAEFPGARNWGYDGVSLFAPSARYGGPEGLRRLVAACHRHGLAVVLDVVLNHLGPEGNWLPEFGPYFSATRRTPWGPAFDFDRPAGEGARGLVLDAARAWFEEFHVDALRLDAVQELVCEGSPHVVDALVDVADAHARASGRPAWLIAETNRNDVRLLEPRGEGGQGVHAQWNDDFHHAVFAALTGARRGRFQDFGALADVRKALVEGFVIDGKYSGYRGRLHGSSSRARPGHQLVVFTENHDQIANDAGGARLSTLISFEAQKLALALTLIAPALPMLFMGQEYGETAPFLYFTDHRDPLLAAAVTAGRRAEHPGTVDDPFGDPQAESTFARCRLDWALLDEPRHASLLACTRALLSLRATTPALGPGGKALTRAEVDEAERWLRVERAHPGQPTVVGLFNFGPAALALPWPGGALALSTAEARFGGPGQPPLDVVPAWSAAIFIETAAPAPRRA